MGTNQKKRRRFLKQLIYIGLFVALAVTGTLGFFRWYSQADLLRMSFTNPDGSKSAVVKLEVVKSEAERRKGLMFRRELASDAGMLFIFPEQKPQNFFMKNTYISLDMIFINSENKVVGVLENVPILNEERRAVSTPSQFVVEVNAAWVAKNKVTAGSVAVYQGTLSGGS